MSGDSKKEPKIIPIGAHGDIYSERCYDLSSAKMHNQFAQVYVDVAFAHNMMCAEEFRMRAL
jgi:hypothetical protein